MSGAEIWIGRPECVLVHDPRDVGRTWRDRGPGYDHEHFEFVPDSTSRISFVYSGGEIDLEPYEPVPFVPGETLDVYPVRTADGAQGYIMARTTPYAEPMSELPVEWPAPDVADGSSQIVEPPSGDGPEIRTWVLDDGTETEIGPVERALREDLSRLKTTANFGTTLLASATALAQAMDRAQPDKIASIGREFREHLKRIEDLSGDDNESVQHRSNLSTPV